MRYKGLEHRASPVTRQGLVCHAEKAVRRELIGLKSARVGRGRTESLISGLAENRQSQENTFRAKRAYLETSEGNGVRELLTAYGGTVAVLKLERLPFIARRGARRGIIQRVSGASRVTIRAGKEQVAATRVKVHCMSLG